MYDEEHFTQRFLGGVSGGIGRDGLKTRPVPCRALDYSHIDFIDARGVEVLNHFAQSQDTRMSAHGFVRELLQIGGRL